MRLQFVIESFLVCLIGEIIGILLWICFCNWRLLGILSGEQGRET
ncbi:hypothetical protein [Pseudoramibacter alactolyticus]|nr:hypothetical protein [Pseudoramibacter alactolyticus]